VQSEWTFDFVLFKKGNTNPIAPSMHSRFYSRSVNLEVPQLDAGEYVVHVRLDRQLKDRVSWPFNAAPYSTDNEISSSPRRMRGTKPLENGTRGSFPESSLKDARANLSLLVSRLLSSLSFVNQMNSCRSDFKLQ